jgi:ABC-type antimicrobial peptide transport system permease subunit
MDQELTDAVAPQRFSATIVTAFAGVSLLLASIGLYGLLAFIVGQRQKEIIPAALVPAALLACAIPAWRAARLDPVAALRAE